MTPARKAELRDMAMHGPAAIRDDHALELLNALDEAEKRAERLKDALRVITQSPHCLYCLDRPRLLSALGGRTGRLPHEAAKPVCNRCLEVLTEDCLEVDMGKRYLAVRAENEAAERKIDALKRCLQGAHDPSDNGVFCACCGRTLP